MLSNVRIVLVRTFHPGNIGSVARAMKTMGLNDLRLVAPKDYPSLEATKMAAGAEDLLANARIADTLSDAIDACTVVAATSVRPRGYELPQLNPSDAAKLLLEHSATSKVALIFGPERMGLHNSDLRHARYRIEIPANPEYSSLNLAAAVQIMAYELFKQHNADHNKANNERKIATRELPTAESIERLHTHLAEVLHRIKFLRPHEGETLQRLRNFINRAEPDQVETNILRGILSAVEKKTPPPK